MTFALDATAKVVDSLDDSGIGTSFDFLDFLTVDLFNAEGDCKEDKGGKVGTETTASY